MNSSTPYKEQLSRIYRTALHPLIAVLVPFLFLTTLLRIFSQLLPIHHVLPPLYYLLLLFTAVLHVILANIFTRERAGAGAKIREFILVMLGIYLYTSVFRTGPFLLRIIPRPADLFPLAFAAIQWYSTSRIQQQLRQREDFMFLAADAHGEDLLKIIRDYQYFAVDTIGDLKKLKFVLSLGLTLLILAMVLLWYFGQPPSPVVTFLFSLFTLSFFSVYTLLSAYIEEFQYYGEGINISPDNRKHRFLIGVCILWLCFIPALFLSADHSLLSPVLILAVLNWLLRFLPFETTGMNPFPAPEQNRPALQEFLRELAQRDRAVQPLPPLFFLIMDILKTLLIIAGAAALLYLFFRPFFSRSFLDYLQKIRPLMILREHTREFLNWLKRILSFFGKRREQELYRTFSGRRAADMEKDTASVKESANPIEKRQETNRIIRGFLKILRWGRRNGIRYSHGQTPEEYTGRLAERFPDLQEDLSAVVDIFEEALFSSHILGSEKEGDFLRRVKTVLRKHPEEATPQENQE